MKRIVAAVAILVVLALGIMSPPAHANKTIFYDNFQSNTLGSQWTFAVVKGNPTVFTSSAGGLWMTSPRSAGAFGGAVASIIANGTDPVLSGQMTTALNPDVLVNEIFYITPSNYTTIQGQRQTYFAFELFGLADNANSCFGASYPTCLPPSHAETPTHWMGFLMEQVNFDFGSGVLTTLEETRVVMDHPATDATTCFGSFVTTCTPGCCSGGQTPDSIDNASRYDTNQAPLDPTLPHIFQLTVSLHQSRPAWVAASVDNMAILNYSEASCHCIGSNFYNLYPFVQTFTLWNNFVPLTSPALAVGYVSITDYIPVNPPRVFLPGPTIPVPSNPATASYSPGYFVGLAASFGGGNVYAGGAFMTIIVICVTGAVMFFVRLRASIFYTMMSLGVIVVGVFLGIDSPLLLIGGVLAVIASFLGILPRGSDSGGGGVTEV